MGNPLDIATSLLSFGGLAGGMGQPERGARLLGAGEALLEARGVVVPEVYRGLYERAVTGMRHAPGEGAYGVAWSAGQMLAPEEAIAEAL